MESIRIGKITCDYTDPEEFLAMCDMWLSSDSFHHIVTLNPEMVMLAEHDKQFAHAVSQADIRTPDGSGLIWARWYLRSPYWSLVPSLVGFMRQYAVRVTGVDALFQLSGLAQKRGQKVYLLGGTPSQAAKTKHVLQKKFPQLAIATSASHLFAIDGPAEIILDIQNQRPSILFVAYGAPKQSKWIEQHRASLPTVRIAIGVGGAFSILAEETPRAPRLLRTHNLEWVWRLLLEPSRLPRIWQAIARFPALVGRQKQTLS